MSFIAFKIAAEVPPEHTPISINFFGLYFLISPFIKYSSSTIIRDFPWSLYFILSNIFLSNNSGEKISSVPELSVILSLLSFIILFWLSLLFLLKII